MSGRNHPGREGHVFAFKETTPFQAPNESDRCRPALAGSDRVGCETQRFSGESVDGRVPEWRSKAERGRFSQIQRNGLKKARRGPSTRGRPSQGPISRERQCKLRALASGEPNVGSKHPLLAARVAQVLQ